jgi:hypothetical protein
MSLNYDLLGALGLVVNVPVLWNTLYMDAAFPPAAGGRGSKARRCGASVTAGPQALVDGIAKGEPQPPHQPHDRGDLAAGTA